MNTLSLDNTRERRSEIATLLERAAIGYVEFTETTATYPHEFARNSEASPGLIYASLGLANETGELAEHVAATIASDVPATSHLSAYQALWYELGDCQWYAARIVCEAPLTCSFPSVVERASALYYGEDNNYREIISASMLHTHLSIQAGKITGVVKKIIRDGQEWDVAKRHAKLKELEDALVQYVARSFQFAQRTAPIMGIEGGYVALMRSNVNKLQGRKDRGTLQGDGEKR